MQVLAVISWVKVDMFPFDRAPEAFDEDIIGRGRCGQQGLLVGPADELVALVEVENVGRRSIA